MKSWDKFLFQKFTDTTTDDLSNAEKAHFIGFNFKCLRTPQLMIMLKRPSLNLMELTSVCFD